MEWSHDTQWMISGGHDGIIKYWHPNFNNLNIIQGHKFPVRDLSFSPTDLKFVSASDDQQLKIWDFRRSKEESSLSGHTWEVRAVDWHPHLGMVASGGKDNMIRVWDPRSTKCLASIGRHNNSITSLEWNQNGRWLLSGGRDHCMKLFDVRNLKEEIMTFATPREIHTIAWHPVHETMFASGGSLCDSKDAINEGTIQFWMTDDPKQKACIEGAHSSQIWSLAWHPMGHILASGSNDKATRFWCRPRPGEHLPTELGGKDADERIFHGPVNSKAASQLASYDETAQRTASGDDKDGSQMSVDTRSGAESPAPGGGPPKPPGGGLPGLQSADIGQMLAKIKQSGIPGLGDRALSSGSQDSRGFGVPPPPPPPPPPPQGYPPAGLPGLSKPPGLPGLAMQQHPPPPPPLSQLPGTQYTMPPSGPVRSEPRTRQSSRFNPIQRSQPPPPPPPPLPPSSRQHTPTQH
ncbi:WD repeat-containing protein 33 [Coemansia guatemalensis]|uniref:Polyadenylation factor subunit 2 n=1 Tax=Coemansia guatemalensis TaxID=2761395 RepID=A0A9W8LTZ4_9FUNG|nr:WD repeat-containing protein 33 [Coemansia guatemalensis]